MAHGLPMLFNILVLVILTQGGEALPRQGRSLFGSGFLNKHLSWGANGGSLSIDYHRPGLKKTRTADSSSPIISQEASPTVIQSVPATVIHSDLETDVGYLTASPTVLQERPSIVYQNVQQTPTVTRTAPTYVKSSPLTIHATPAVLEKTLVSSPTFEKNYHVQQTIYNQGTPKLDHKSLHRGVSVSPSFTGSASLISGQTIHGGTRVVEEETEEVVEEVKQTIIETKTPTIIRKKTPTYIQETLKQHVIHEQTPEIVRQQRTEYVTETKPMYVTETKPVTVTENKLVMKTRDRVVNVPGETIITKGPTEVTYEEGTPTHQVLRGDAQSVLQGLGFRSIGFDGAAKDEANKEFSQHSPIITKLSRHEMYVLLNDYLKFRRLQDSIE